MNASRKIGVGGVLRDCFGEWCGGFVVNLGKGIFWMLKPRVCFLASD